MLSFTDVTLRRGAKVLFSDVSFTIHAGRKVGVVGANGAGKSSLFALIRNELEADAGSVRLPAGTTIGHVAQEHPAVNRTALDYVLDGDVALRRIESRLEDAERDDDGHRVAELHGELHAIDAYTAPARAAAVLHGLGFDAGDEARGVATFSGGWRRRLNLAQALMSRSDLVLLDEPTNHLDLDAVIWLESWLLAFSGTLLVVSHDRDFLDPVVDTIAHVAGGTVKLYRGDYSAFEKSRAEQLARQRAAYAKQRRITAHMRSFVERFRYKASKARQAQSRLKALERMQTIAAAHVDSAFQFSFRKPDRLPEPLIALDGAAAGYAELTVLSALRFNLMPGDRIGLLGRNGAGKSTLIKLLSGELPTRAGVVEASPHLRIGYFAQHQLDQLRLDRSPIAHLRELDAGACDQALRNFLGGFNFHGDAVLRPVEQKSGGEKARLALALVLYARPNLLLLDEPTNHLDLEMRHALGVALQDFPGAVMVVSHDRYLLGLVSDALWLVAGGRVSAYDGDLEDYARWLRTRQPAGSGTRMAPVEARKPSSRPARERRKQAADRRHAGQPMRDEIRRLEGHMQRLHRKKSEMEAKLADETLYTGEQKERLQDLLIDQGRLAMEIETTEARWLSASEELERLESPAI